MLIEITSLSMLQGANYNNQSYFSVLAMKYIYNKINFKSMLKLYWEFPLHIINILRYKIIKSMQKCLVKPTEYCWEKLKNLWIIKEVWIRRVDILNCYCLPVWFRSETIPTATRKHTDWEIDLEMSMAIDT